MQSGLFDETYKQCALSFVEVLTNNRANKSKKTTFIKCFLIIMYIELAIKFINSLNFTIKLSIIVESVNLNYF
jgi:hypothetical protein